MKLDGAQILSMTDVQQKLGESSRSDGKPVSRGTVMRCIEAGLPAHRLTESSPWYFLSDELEAFVGNRWNRRTPDETSPRRGGQDGAAA